MKCHSHRGLRKFHNHRESSGRATIIHRPQEMIQSQRGPRVCHSQRAIPGIPIIIERRSKCHKYIPAPGSTIVIEAPGSVTIIERPQEVSQVK